MPVSQNPGEQQKKRNIPRVLLLVLTGAFSAAIAIYSGVLVFECWFANLPWGQNASLRYIQQYSLSIFPSMLVGFLMKRLWFIAALGSLPWVFLIPVFLPVTLIYLPVTLIQLISAFVGYRIRLRAQRSNASSLAYFLVFAIPTLIFIATPSMVADRAWLEFRRFGLAIETTFSGAVEDPFEDGLTAYAEKDFVKAYLRWEPLAKAGHAQVQYRLGGLTHMVPGLDRKNALYWYKKAAEQGLVEAQFEVGLRQTDPAEALSWYRKAASKNYALARTKIGRAYQYGLGVTRDHSEALKWYLMAADQGYVEAQIRLGKLYKWGIDGKPDVIRAYAWFETAAGSSQEARLQRDKLQKGMSKSQLGEAQALAEDLKPNNQN